MNNLEKPSATNWTRQNWIWIATAAAAVIGAVLRIRQYLAGRSLWLDEALLALNILDRTYQDLLEKLDYSQGAPIGFLLVEKVAANLIGQGEYGLRLFPLVAGLLALVIFPLVARRYLTPRSALWATILFAFASPLIYYASEVKQYSVDVLATVLCLVMFLYMVERSLRAIDVVWLGALGAALVWLSHPSIFVLAASGIIVAVICYREGNWRSLVLVLVVGFFWIASFLVNLLVSLESLVQNQILLDFWRGGFIPLSDPPIVVFEWVLNKFLVLFDVVIGLPLKGLALAFALFGGFAMARRNKPLFFSLVLPIILVLAASALRRYPFLDRLILFLAPLVILLLAEGIEQLLLLSVERYQKAAAFLVVFLLLFQAVEQAFDNPIFPAMNEDAAQVMDYTRQHWLDGDMIYVYYAAYPAFKFYLPNFPFPEDKIIKGADSREDWTEYYRDMDMLASEHERVWLIFSHVYGGKGAEEDVLLTHYLDQTGGLQIDKFKAAGATTYLYEFSHENESGMQEQSE